MINVNEVKGDEYSCICPLHEDNNASLFINVKKNKAICFAGCYSGSAVALISKLEKIPKYAAWRKMVSGEVFSFERKFAKKSTVAFSDTANGVHWLSGDKTKYLIDRNFTRSTIKYWGIEYSSEVRHIRIPVHTIEGKLHCYSYRTIDNLEPKYLHPGLDKYNGMLFGEFLFEPCGKIVNIVEGALDCIWLWQNGFRNVLAFLGYPTDKQISRLFDFGNIFRLCLDNDQGGLNIRNRIIDNTKNKDCEIIEIVLPENVKDVQEIESKNLNKFLCK